MKYDIPKPGELQLSVNQIRRFIAFIFCDDLDFYIEYIIYLSDEQQQKFFENNPDFMSEYHVNCDRTYLLKDRIYRGILKKIKIQKQYQNSCK